MTRSFSSDALISSSIYLIKLITDKKPIPVAWRVWVMTLSQVIQVRQIKSGSSGAKRLLLLWRPNPLCLQTTLYEGDPTIQMLNKHMLRQRVCSVLQYFNTLILKSLHPAFAHHLSSCSTHWNSAQFSCQYNSSLQDSNTPSTGAHSFTVQLLVFAYLTVYWTKRQENIDTIALRSGTPQQPASSPKLQSGSH